MSDASRRQIITSGSALFGLTAGRDSGLGTMSKSVSVADFGAAGDGRDQTRAVQRAYDSLVARGGGTLYFPPGTYPITLTLTSRDVHLQGGGAGATQLLAPRPESTILTALYRNGAQTAAYISDLDLIGSGAFQSVLFRAGGDAYVPFAEYSGGTHFSRVRFHNAAKSIERRFGSIVLVVDQCTFTDADYHFFSTSNSGKAFGVEMHAGCIFVSKSRILGFRKAMFYVKSPVQGAGQIIFQENIVENGSGFVFYIDGFSATHVPGVAIRDQWNESTANGKQVDVAGQIHQNASFLFARNCTAPIVVENTPIAAAVLENSVLHTRDCDITDFSFIGDERSVVWHEGAYAFSGTPPGTCRSIAGPSLADGLRTPWFRMSPVVFSSPLYRAATLQMFDGSAPIAFSGSRSVATTQVNDPAVGTAAQDIRIEPGDRISPPSFRVRGGTWLAISYIAKIVDGDHVDVQITGQSGLSGICRIKGLDWDRYVGIIQADADHEPQYLLHMAERRSTIRIGAVAVTQFSSRQQAQDYLNNGAFPG